jgi:hypothetical protein
MRRLLAIVFAVGLAGMTAGPVEAECLLTRSCTNVCYEHGEAPSSCRPSCRSFLICDARPDRSAKSRLPGTRLPQGSLPQSQLPASQMPSSAFN